MTIAESYFLVMLLIGTGYLQTSITELIFLLKFSRAATYPLNPESVGSKKLSWLLIGSNKPMLFHMLVLKSITAILLLILLFSGTVPFFMPLLLVLFDQLAFFRSRLLGRSEAPLQRVALVTASIHLLMNDKVMSQIGLVFISLMLCLAYFATGYQKQHDPKWRNGEGVLNFLERYLAHTHILRPLLNMPKLLKFASYTVVLFEFCFFLSLLHPQLAMILFSIGVLFHLSISVAAGINEFLWAFTGCYPAVFYVSYLISNEVNKFF